MSIACFNGTFLSADQPLFTLSNRGFKYGDGVFETIKVMNGQIQLGAYHFERLFLGMQMLQINAPAAFTSDDLSRKILDLANRNGCADHARIRLAVYRNDQNFAEYCIEAMALKPEKWQADLALDIYPFARKSQDAFSNLKSSNFLPYVMAGRYASDKGLDDCLILNNDHLLCDTSKANIFIIKDERIFTPSLDQGCVSGVMRRLIIDELKKKDFIVHQKPLGEEHLLTADEVFLTNAIMGMKGVRSFRNHNYNSVLSEKIYKMLFATN